MRVVLNREDLKKVIAPSISTHVSAG